MAGKYYVMFVDDTPIPVYGPYSFKSAKDFARIGSQGKSRRVVTYGRKVGARVVRVYWKTYRLWPVGQEEIGIAGLRGSEWPRDPVPYVSKTLRGPFVSARERLATEGLPIGGTA